MNIAVMEIVRGVVAAVPPAASNNGRCGYRDGGGGNGCNGNATGLAVVNKSSSGSSSGSDSGYGWYLLDYSNSILTCAVLAVFCRKP